MKSYLKCSENRLTAWVCGGGEQAITSCLRGALPEAKRKGGEVMGEIGAYIWAYFANKCYGFTDVVRHVPQIADNYTFGTKT